MPFNHAVADNGYAWWYIDAESDDGRHALTLIAFVGHVFSPYYARAQRLAPADPMQHCAFNIALYGGARRWALTERSAAHVQRDATHFQIADNAMQWRSDHLAVTLRDRTSPWRTDVAGEVRLYPTAAPFDPVRLAPGHTWWPVAPCARIEVELASPKLTWSGRAYHDSNFGDEPLADAFSQWTWLRALHPQGTMVRYHSTAHHDAAPRDFGMLYRHDGTSEPWEHTKLAPGPRSRWGLPQTFPEGFADLRRCEDTPFYTRNQVRIDSPDGPLQVMHESLNLQRFTQPWVQFLVPFRMRRVG